jgi:heme/copper-type cytochrome/quinol oxidase subunit 3
MTSAPEPLAAVQVPHTGIWPLETNRGVYAVSMLIITEAALFVCLFASYYFLANNKDRWAIDIPPKLTLALVMLAILIASSLVMMWGERMVKLGRYSVARFAVILTVLMGLIFVAIQTTEYRDHWKSLTPFTDSYGSIFYTITTFHAAHVVMGILMLCYLAILPNYGPSKFPPHRPYRVVALYWHFVDIVWIFVVVLLYLIPNYQAYVH